MKTLTVYDGGATTELIAQGGFDSRLTGLAPNSWVDLGLFQPTVPAGENLTEAQLWFGNGGLDYDLVRRQIAIFAGGHSGTNYNTVGTISLADCRYREEYPPTPAQPDMTWANYSTQMLPGLGGTAQVGMGAFLQDLSGIGGPYPRPAARHTCDMIQVIGDYLYLFALVEGNGPNTQQGVLLGQPSAVYVFNCKAQVARYHFPTKAWQFENLPVPQTDGGGGNALYGATKVDPLTGKVLWIDSSGLYIYDATVWPGVKTKPVTWFVGSTSKLLDESGNQILAAQADLGNGTGSLTYDPAGDVFYYCTVHDAVWRVNYDRANPAATTMTRLTAIGTSPAAAHPPNAEHSHRWDKANRVIGVGPFNSVFYTFDPATKAWSQTTIPVPVGSQCTNSHFMEYCEDANVYLWYADATNPVTALRRHWIAYRWK